MTALFILLIPVAVVILGSGDRKSRRDRADRVHAVSLGDESVDPTCALETDPPGATVVAICHDEIDERMNAAIESSLAAQGLPSLGLPSTFEMTVGTTPIRKTPDEWLADGIVCGGPLVARLPGYASTPVSMPLQGVGCARGATTMRSLNAEAP